MSNSQKPIPETKTPPPTVDIGETSNKTKAILPPDGETTLRPNTSTNPTIVNR